MFLSTECVGTNICSITWQAWGWTISPSALGRKEKKLSNVHIVHCTILPPVQHLLPLLVHIVHLVLHPAGIGLADSSSTAVKWRKNIISVLTIIEWSVWCKFWQDRGSADFRVLRIFKNCKLVKVSLKASLVRAPTVLIKILCDTVPLKVKWITGVGN